MTDCAQCTPGYVCESTGIAYDYQMVVCPQGFICPEGTKRAVILSTKGYYGPQKVSSSDSLKDYKCPKGYYCPEGTGIGEEMLTKCKSNINDCIVGFKCPRGSYCPAGSYEGINCPLGTFSEEGADGLYDCKNDLSLPTTVYEVISAFGFLNVTTNILQNYYNLEPFAYAVFTFNTSEFPESKMPDDYILTIQYTDELQNKIKIPFVESVDYTPLHKIPLPLTYSNSVSAQNQTWDFAILAHKYVKIEFNLELLYGLLTDDSIKSLFYNCITLTSIKYPTRNKDQSFLAVMNRLSNDDFNDPSNLAIHMLLPEDEKATDYQEYVPKLTHDISVTMLGNLDEPKDSFYNQDTIKLWDSLMISQNLYPIDYLPYITDCDEYGANIPIHQIITHPDCDIVKSANTILVDILSPLKKPKGDICNVNITCRYSENSLSSSIKDN